jgi:hypothetical protein
MTETDKEQRRKAGKKADAMGQYLELVSIFKEASRNFIFAFASHHLFIKNIRLRGTSLPRFAYCTPFAASLHILFLVTIYL